MDRKTFLKKSAGAMLIAIPAYTLIGCSSSEDESGNPDPNQNANANCVANGTIIAIGSNHGHSLTVSKADVQAAVTKTYSIQGSSGHGHSVTLSAANFESLKGNNTISVISTNDDSHTHSVNVSCA